MINPRFAGGAGALLAIVAAVVLYNAHGVGGSDHQDSPTVVARPAADLTDVYVFPSPSNSSNVVLEMNVYPLISPTMVTSVALDPSVLYQFRIAHGSMNGVGRAGFSGTQDDMVLQFQAVGSGPSQTINVYGPAAPPNGGTSTSQKLVSLAGAVPFNSTTAPNVANGIRVFVGPRADPFFFDLAQFFKIIPDRNYQNQPNPPAATAATFRGFASATQTSGTVTASSCDTSQAQDILSANHFNVIAIVAEIPKSVLAPSGGGQVIAVHATTSTVSGS